MTDTPDDFSVLGLIPARGGSKGIFRKNVKSLYGKPLIAYTIEAASRSKSLSYFCVSSDDEEIISVSRAWGAEVPFERPAELASDHARQIDVIKHAVELLEKSRGAPFSAFVLLQPTTPLRTHEDIDSAIEILRTTRADSVISLCEATQLPQYMYRMNDDRPVPLVSGQIKESRRQDVEKTYVRNGAIYAVRRDVLFTHDNLYGNDCRAIFMPWERSVNIDAMPDWELAEYLMKKMSS